MAAITGFSVAKDLCKVLGLDPRKVSRIVLDVQCDDVVKVYVSSYLQSTEVDGFLLLLGGASSKGLVRIERDNDVS